MSTESNSGAEPETQTPPTGEAGCETEIDRNVLGTVASTGLAEWLQEVQGTLDCSEYLDLSMTHERFCVYLEGVRARLRRILDAKDETR